MHTTTRSAITLFATLYTLALLTGSPTALRPWQKIFQKDSFSVSISVDSVRRTSRAAEKPSAHHIKECTVQITPYLNFNGNCKEAFEFYERTLKGKIEAMMPHAGSPAEQHTTPEWRNKILHARLNVNGGILMASDAPPQGYKQPEGFAVSLNLTDIPEAERIFRELAADARITMPLQPTFWAARFGMLTDRFGIPWMINCEQPTA
ncbi:VOC family protein [Edaphobacter aggregans]|uniref:VOC family protein n=1 Tax=Edaphobacter aggregans TaxID=570835 RepID=UPI000AACAA57|nr:VOC family protein [Edaphobacter aggregans]